jgi:hypothetical protein
MAATAARACLFGVVEAEMAVRTVVLIEQFEIDDSGITHKPTSWRFTAYQDSPTDGRLGDKLETGEDFRPNEVEELARRLWARHLEARKKQLLGSITSPAWRSVGRAQMPLVIDILITAVRNGELDQQLAQAKKPETVPKYLETVNNLITLIETMTDAPRIESKENQLRERERQQQGPEQREHRR